MLAILVFVKYGLARAHELVSVVVVFEHALFAFKGILLAVFHHWLYHGGSFLTHLDTFFSWHRSFVFVGKGRNRHYAAVQVTKR